MMQHPQPATPHYRGAVVNGPRNNASCASPDCDLGKHRRSVVPVKSSAHAYCAYWLSLLMVSGSLRPLQWQVLAARAHYLRDLNLALERRVNEIR